MPNLLPALLILIMWTLPVCLSLMPYFSMEPSSLMAKVGSLALAAPIFVMSFLLISGGLSRTAQHAIIRGRFPRENFHKIYFWRRIYGCCWTTVYYFKPLYHVLLTIPVLRKFLFRLFGYKGPLKFTIYPDTWVRDLPLLHFGEGSYCSNRSTIGSNMCLIDGTILVDRIYIGDRSIVGHLAMLAPGVKLGHDAEVGVGCALGIRCRMQDGSRLGAGSSVNHGTIIGARTEVGGHSAIGLRADIGPDLKIPGGAMIPAGASLRDQTDVDKYISSENQILRTHTDQTAEDLKSAIQSLEFNE